MIFIVLFKFCLTNHIKVLLYINKHQLPNFLSVNRRAILQYILSPQNSTIFASANSFQSLSIFFYLPRQCLGKFFCPGTQWNQHKVIRPTLTDRNLLQLFACPSVNLAILVFYFSAQRVIKLHIADEFKQFIITHHLSQTRSLKAIRRNASQGEAHSFRPVLVTLAYPSK